MRTLDTGTERFAHGAEHVWHRIIATGGSHSMLPIRLAFGLIFMAHGAQKLFGWFGGPGLEAVAQGFGGMGFSPPMFWATVAALVELGGGLLLLLGLFTRAAAALIAVQMLVAMFVVHWKNGFFSQQGGIEYTLALAAGMLAAVFYGGGAASVDRRLTLRDRTSRTPQ